jgi:hypothetical protein
MGMTGRMLTNLRRRRPSDQVRCPVHEQVWPGDTLDATATVEAIRKEGGKSFVDLTVSTVNQNGVEVIKGNATARVD